METIWDISLMKSPCDAENTSNDHWHRSRISSTSKADSMGQQQSQLPTPIATTLSNPADSMSSSIRQPAFVASQPITSASRTLGTIEVLEQILLHLPTRDLFHCQRVSRTFRGTIIGSIQLRRKLFLTPCNGDSNKIRLNPLLARRRINLADSHYVYQYFDQRDSPLRTTEEAPILLPNYRVPNRSYLLEPLFGAVSSSPYNDPRTGCMYLSLDLRQYCQPDDNSVLESSSIWDMHFCQPPMETRITVWKYSRTELGDLQGACVLKLNVRGGTVREVLEQIKSAQGTAHQDSVTKCERLGNSNAKQQTWSTFLRNMVPMVLQYWWSGR